MKGKKQNADNTVQSQLVFGRLRNGSRNGMDDGNDNQTAFCRK